MHAFLQQPPSTTVSTSYLTSTPSPTDHRSPWRESPHDGTNIQITISNSDGSTGKGILIGMLSAFGSAAFVVLIFAIFYFFRYTSRGRIFLDRIGRPGEYDDEQALAREEVDALEDMDDLQRTEYLRAKAFIQANPPETLPTDISLSQFLAIQEKGVSAWEFEPELEIANCFVEARTEIEFFDSECSVQSNLPIPKQNEVYYWEAKIYDKPESSLISIGWHKSSISYTSTGQRRYNQPFTPTGYGPSYVQGDVIGVGYRPRTGTVFFTRNGKKLEDVAHGLKSQNFFPTVGANGPCTVHVNFGQSGFVFIEANVKKWGLAPMTGSLAPPPPYGSEQGSILLEAGRDGSRIHAETFQPRARTSSMRPASTQPMSPGPLRSPTEISLAQLEHIPSHEDIGEGTSRAAPPPHLGSGVSSHDPQEFAVPPPEYTSPEGSIERSIRNSRDDDEGDDDGGEEEGERRPLIPPPLEEREQGEPQVPSYDAAMAGR